MSDDREKEVIEKTRRPFSGIHTMTGVIFKTGERKNLARQNENDIKNPLVGIAIVIGCILGTFVGLYLIMSIFKFFTS